MNSAWSISNVSDKAAVKTRKKGRNAHAADQFESPSASPTRQHSNMEHFIDSNGFSTHSPQTSSQGDWSVLLTSNDSKKKSRVAESPMETRIESSATTVKEIEGDKREAQYVIANYGIDPVEMLHMGEYLMEHIE